MQINVTFFICPLIGFERSENMYIYVFFRIEESESKMKVGIFGENNNAIIICLSISLDIKRVRMLSFSK